jgi:trehalose/maltose hydrolase-like predicted phosphorylase
MSSSFFLYPTLAISQAIFATNMTTYYCHTLEDALRRAKAAGKKPGCYFGGITLRSGKKGFAIYREGKVIEQYSVIGR